VAKFDVEGARKAGYSDDEIRQFLLQSDGAKQAKEAGYSDDEILGHFGLSTATAQAPATPEASTGGELARLAGIAGGGIAQGIAAGAALPNTLEQATNWAYRKGAGALGFEVPSQESIDVARYSGPIGALSAATAPPSAATTVGAVKSMGLGGPEPQNLGERLLSGTAKGIGASLVPGGGGLSLGNAATGAAAGLGSEIGSEVAPGTVAGPLIGGLVGGVAAGVPKSIAEVVAANRGVKSAEQGLESAQTGATDAADALTTLQRQREQMGIDKQQMNQTQQQQLTSANEAASKVANDTAQTLGKSTTLQEAGQNLQEAAKNWFNKTFPQKKEQIWAPVDAIIPDNTEAPLFGFSNALGDINKQAGAAQPLLDALTPSLPRKLANTLQEQIGSPVGKKGTPEVQAPTGLVDAAGNPIMKTVKEAEPPQPITWADARKLRTAIGDALGNPMAVKDIDRQSLEHMYAALSGDLESAAANVSPEALQAFQKANQETTQLFDVANGPMSKLVTAPTRDLQGSNPEQVANSILGGGKKGATDLATLRAEIPDAVNELGATALRSGQWSKLSPEAKAQIVTDPGARKLLDDSYGAIDNLAQAHGAAEIQHAEDLIKLNRDIAAARLAKDAAKSEQQTAKSTLSEAQAEQAEQRGRWSPYGPFGFGLTGGGLATAGETLGQTLGNPLGFQGAGALGSAMALGAPVAGMLVANPTVRQEALKGARIGGTLGMGQK